jgi:thiamine biosynthesis lipoprotein
MGTHLEISVIADDRTAALAASEAAVSEVERAELRLSTWRDDSELSRVNRSQAGTWVRVSARLSDDLAEAMRWWRRSDGWFNPGVAALIRAWDLRGRGRIPDEREIATALRASDLSSFELAQTAVRRGNAALGIEEGGFGKGMALRDAAEAALAAGASCVRLDFGGQTHLAGSCRPIELGIAHPSDRDAVLATLTVASGSAATSGNSERGLLVDGVRVGHLLDPRSGRPAPDFGSVTVLASDPVAADCLATALYAMGPERASAWLQARAGFDAVFAIDRGGPIRLFVTDSLLDRVQGLAAEVELLPIERLEAGPPISTLESTRVF